MRAEVNILLAALAAAGLSASACDADPVDTTTALPPIECPWGGPTGPELEQRIGSYALSGCQLEPVDLAALACGHEATVISVGAAWCQPCRDEVPVFKDELHAPYGDKGLQIVQILTQQVSGSPATSATCRDWVQQFDVPFPVLVDPLFLTEELLPQDNQAFPLTLLIDRDGVIRKKWSGGIPEDLVPQTKALLGL